MDVTPILEEPSSWFCKVNNRGDFGDGSLLGWALSTLCIFYALIMSGEKSHYLELVYLVPSFFFGGGYGATFRTYKHNVW